MRGEDCERDYIIHHRPPRVIQMTPYYDTIRIPRLPQDTDFAAFDKWTNASICPIFNDICTTLASIKRNSLATFHKALAHWWSTSYTSSPTDELLYLRHSHWVAQVFP